jgi:hypothetical protein
MMIEDEDDNEDPTAPSLLELSKSPPKRVDNEEDEYEIDDNIRTV